MQRLEYKKKNRLIPWQYESDVERLVQDFAKCGYMVNDVDAYRAWCDFSYEMAAGWMMLYDDPDANVRSAIPYLRES